MKIPAFNKLPEEARGIRIDPASLTQNEKLMALGAALSLALTLLTMFSGGFMDKLLAIIATVGVCGAFYAYSRRLEALAFVCAAAAMLIALPSLFGGLGQLTRGLGGLVNGASMILRFLLPAMVLLGVMEVLKDEHSPLFYLVVTGYVLLRAVTLVVNLFSGVGILTLLLSAVGLVGDFMLYIFGSNLIFNRAR